MDALDPCSKNEQTLLDSVLDTIQDGVLFMDGDLNILQVNRWMEERFAGRMPLVGKSMHTVLKNGNDGPVQHPQRGSIQQRASHVEVLAFPDETNPDRWFEVSVLHLKGSDHGQIRFIGQVRDITDRKQGERFLEEEITRRRILVEQSSDGIVVLEKNGKVLEANREFAHMLGYSMEDVHKLYVWDWDAQWNRQELQEMLRTIDERGDHFETRHRRKDGSLYDVEISTNGAVYRGQKLIFCVCRDISARVAERKKIEADLRLTRFSFDKASIGIFQTGEDARILDANPHACRLLGYRRKELCRMSLHDIDTGESQLNRIDLWRQLIENGSVGFETQLRRKDGSVFPVDVDANLFEFEGGRHSVSFVRDLTEKKNHEKQKAAMEDHLRQTQRMEALGTLAGGIAHDFNNIIAAIHGYSELAQLRCPDNSKLRNYLEQITTASIRAKNLVQQILTFSRKGKTEKRIIDISSIVEETLTLIRATLPSTIEIRTDVASSPGDVLADESLIHQVVVNLCTNAYQAMGNKGGLLEVSLTAVTVGTYDSTCYPVISPGRYLKLVVADTGQGVDHAHMDRIFDPYFTTKKPGEGTGMGLSTVHGIVKDHGGSIKVYSQPGVGTTVQVFFPLSESAGRPSGADTAAFSPGSAVILFVDDEAQLRDIGSDLLEGLGYLVETRVNPVDAIEAFRLNPLKYDLLITDWTMPKMTGGELARKVRGIRPNIPIIVCTGLPMAVDDADLKKIGVRHVLPKPVTLKRLAAVVSSVLENRPVKR